MPSNVTSALSYVISAISSIILAILLLRLMLPLLRADFRNPIAQAILKITSPAVIPVRRIIPSVGRVDTATILLAFIIQVLALWLIFKMMGFDPTFSYLAFEAAKKLVVLSIQIFVFAIFIRIIISWIAPGQYTPISAIVGTISEPVLSPLRRIIPPLGGFDISPLLAIIALTALTIVIGGIPPLTT